MTEDTAQAAKLRVEARDLEDGSHALAQVLAPEVIAETVAAMRAKADEVEAVSVAATEARENQTQATALRAEADALEAGEGAIALMLGEDVRAEAVAELRRQADQLAPADVDEPAEDTPEDA